MPNWCSNEVTLTHSDPAFIKRVLRGIKKKALFNEFSKCPKALVNTESAHYADEAKRKAHEKKTAANLKKYGAADWYDWRVKEWGTKWDVDDASVEDSTPNSVTLRFDTAWSPPIAWYEKMLGLGFEVRALYYEGGMSFAGIWDNGADGTFEGIGSSTTAARVLPPELDEAFGISENLAMCEEDARDES